MVGIEVAGGYTENGTPVQMWNCKGGPNRRWQFLDGQFIGIANSASMSPEAIRTLAPWSYSVHGARLISDGRPAIGRTAVMGAAAKAAS